MVPTGKRQAIVNALEDEGIDYVITDETSGRDYTAVVTFPLPASAVEPVLEDLREAGIGREAYTVVLDAETVVSRRFDEIRDRYEVEAEGSVRIAREELVAQVTSLVPDWWTYMLMTVASAVVATAGLLLDSPAVVVGSMVIAPLIGPALAASVGTVVDDDDLFRQGLHRQLVGGVTAIAAATAFAVLVRTTNVVSHSAAEVFALAEVSDRLAPDVLSLAVALVAGGAGALSLSVGISAALVGVMIAAALVPPTAAVGIGIAWWEPRAIVGPLVLVLVNLLSINLAALGVLWWQGYRPERLFRLREARDQTIKHVFALFAVILLLSAFLGGVTYGSHQSATFETSARETTVDYLSDRPTLSLLSMEVRYDDQIPYPQPTTVVVTVGHAADMEPPPVAQPLAERINRIDRAPLGLSEPRRIDVVVRYVAVDRTG